MVNLIVASYCMILAQQPGIEDNPRLQKPVSIVSGTISTKQILARVSKATGVKLAWKCGFEDPLMALSVKGETAGDVLRMVSECLNLDWRNAGAGYELYMPASTAKKEQQYKARYRQAVASLLAKKAIEWCDPSKQLKACEAEVGYTRQIFSSAEMLQVVSVLSKPNQARLVNGETLVFSTNGAPGTELMKPASQRIPRPDAEFMAIRLDAMRGKLRACLWATMNGKWASYHAGIFPLYWDLAESYPERELIRRSGYADPWKTDIDDDSIDLHVQKLTEKDIRAMTSVPAGFDDIDTWFKMFPQYHFGPVIAVRPPLVQFNYPLVQNKYIIGIPFSQYWHPGLGYFREYDNATYWRPVNYWYRNELARTQRVGNLASYKDSSFLTLMDNIATIGLANLLWNTECFGLDSSVTGTPPSRLPSFCRFWKSMSAVQKKSSIESVAANAAYTRKRPPFTPKSLLLSELRPDQRSLARMAVKEMLAGPWVSDNAAQPNAAKLLDPRIDSKLYFKVQAARVVNMVFSGTQGCYQPGDGVLPPSKWKPSYNSPIGKSLFGVGYWIVWLTFGIKDGPEITSLFIQYSPFVRIPANVVNGKPQIAYQRFLEAVNKPVY